MLSPFPSYCIPHINPSKKYYLHFADGDWGSERLGNEFKVHTAGNSWSPEDPGHLIPSLTLSTVLGHCLGRQHCGWARIMASSLGRWGKFGAEKLVAEFSGSGFEILGASTVGLATASLRLRVLKFEGLVG